MRRFIRWIKSFFKKPTVNAPVKPEQIEASPTAEEARDQASLSKVMRTNALGLALIIKSEGFYPDPYLCPANVPTIGYGTTYYEDGTKVKLTDPPVTRERARELLQHELQEKENKLYVFLRSIGFNATSNQFSALMSFSYNLGLGPVLNTDRTMNQALLTKDPMKVADAFLIYNKARVGVFRRLKELRGLTIRRKAERELFLKK